MCNDIYIVEYYKHTAEYYLRKFYDQFEEFVEKRYKYRLELKNGVTITAVGFSGDIQSEYLYFAARHECRKFRGEDLMERAYQDYIKDLKAQLEDTWYGDDECDEPEYYSNFSETITRIFNNRYKRQVEREAREGIPLEEDEDD